MDYEKLFLEQLPLIERVIASVCRRNACFGDDAQEFEALVKLRLCEDGYAVLRKFRGRSSLATYLTTVIHNRYRDYRIARWGKWRPSAMARRMGETAVQLEILIRRDEFSVAEAIEILSQNLKVAESRPELERMAERLPPRPRRRIEGEGALAGLVTEDGVERRVADAERSAILRRAEAALARALGRLAVEDRLLLKMRFQDGVTVAGIAAALRVKPRALYSRFEKCLRGLRAAMEGEGVSGADVAEILGWEGSELSIDYRTGKPGRRSV